MLAFIYHSKSIEFKTNKLNLDILNDLFLIIISDDILLLPDYSVSLLWNEDILKKTFKIDGKEVTLEEIIKDNDLLFHHLSLVLNTLIEGLPSLIKYKLGINKRLKNKLELKHSVEYSLLHT
jgi:hypothetical protein